MRKLILALTAVGISTVAASQPTCAESFVLAPELTDRITAGAATMPDHLRVVPQISSFRQTSLRIANPRARSVAICFFCSDYAQANAFSTAIGDGQATSIASSYGNGRAESITHAIGQMRYALPWEFGHTWRFER